MKLLSIQSCVGYFNFNPWALFFSPVYCSLSFIGHKLIIILKEILLTCANILKHLLQASKKIPLQMTRHWIFFSDICWSKFLLEVYGADFVTALTWTLLLPVWKAFSLTQNQIYVSDTSRNPLQSYLVFHLILNLLLKTSFWANFTHPITCTLFYHICFKTVFKGT